MLIQLGVLSSIFPLLKTFGLTYIFFSFMESKQQIHFQGQISALPFRSRKIKVKWKKRKEEENVAREVVICLPC